MNNVKEKARLSLANAAYDPKKLTLIYVGVSTAASLVLSILAHFLDLGIAGTGGLDGMGMRAVLSSLQSILSLVFTVALPFWELGFIFAALGLSRQEQVGPETLIMGFRHFKPALRLFLLQFFLFTGITMACFYIAYTVYMLTPFSDTLLAMLEAGELTLESDIPTLISAMLPIYGFFGLALLVIGVPMLYRYRLANFILADGEQHARRAMGLSTYIMRGRRMQLFRLDLSFWWYYALNLVISVIAYADTLLPLLGIQLPINPNVSFWLFYGVYMVLRLLVSWQFAAYVQTTYAHCYQSFRQYAQPAAPNPQTDALPEN